MFEFHGSHRRAYFEGWYCKHQQGGDVVAFIPAVHSDAQGNRTASLQIVTPEGTNRALYSASAFAADPATGRIRIGASVFGPRGCRLRVDVPGLQVRGRLLYGPLTPPAADIMGPFRYVPGMQCRHSVVSLHHEVDGWVTVNGRTYRFDDGDGYIEGDRGRSFPQRYCWTQCHWQQEGEPAVLMVSAATIPLYGGQFTGCIGSLYRGGKEYRLATWRGARVLSMGAQGLVVRQGTVTLRVTRRDGQGQPLHAPQHGAMTRTIHEHPACRVCYHLTDNGHTVLDLESDRAAWEWSDAGTAASPS